MLECERECLLWAINTKLEKTRLTESVVYLYTRKVDMAVLQGLLSLSPKLNAKFGMPTPIEQFLVFYREDFFVQELTC